MGVQKERKSTFLTAFEQREKEARSLLLHNIDIAVVSECLCHLRAQYPIKSPDIYIGQQILHIDIDHLISRLEWLCFLHV